jgi:hypothetical protein
MPAKGREYELLVREIFQALLDQTEVKNTAVLHDVQLQGKTLTHQIDVYWEFEIGGISYRTVIQAKNWNSPVKQGDLLKFRGVLDDLPGQPRGIFVTKTGYQQGAREYAEAHGIELLLLSELSMPRIELKSNGGFAHVRILPEITHFGLAVEVTVFDPIISELRFKVDKDWVNTSGIARETIPPLSPVPPDEIVFYDREGGVVTTLAQFEAQEVKRIYSDEGRMCGDVVHNFAPHVLLRHPSAQLLELVSVSFNVELSMREPFVTRLQRRDVAQYILRNVRENTVRYITKDDHADAASG